MESVFKIKQFDELSGSTQQEIQDFISGITHKWQIQYYSHCDLCNKQKELTRLESEGGIVRVCEDCKKTIDKEINNIKTGDSK